MAVSKTRDDESTREQTSNLLRRFSPSLASFSPAYREWRDAVANAESVVLRELGFTLHWIPDSHPHRFILYFARVVGLDRDAARRAWRYCNDSCRIDLCARFDAEVTACAAIHLATIDDDDDESRPRPPPTYPKPWWEVFLGPNRNQELSDVVAALLGLTAADEPAVVRATERAAIEFVPSLVPGGSFNDPGSRLWRATDARDGRGATEEDDPRTAKVAT